VGSSEKKACTTGEEDKVRSVTNEEDKKDHAGWLCCVPKPA